MYFYNEILTQRTRCLGGIKKYVKMCTKGQNRHPVVTTPTSLESSASRVSSHESPRNMLTWRMIDPKHYYKAATFR